MAVTITWKINNEFHSNDSEKYIHFVEFQATGIETVGTGSDAITYETKFHGGTALDRPDTLIAYDTFNKQATLVTAIKTKIGATEVTNIENGIKLNIYRQQNPSSSIPPD
tara:strand:+ start:2569 stop:2898 length:330 start_codon:yes stop_codon:yes gene_type:complete